MRWWHIPPDLSLETFKRNWEALVPPGTYIWWREAMDDSKFMAQLHLLLRKAGNENRPYHN